jgi:peptidoglycan hydrolase-like protein with peptidoglycan-binding domain
MRRAVLLTTTAAALVCVAAVGVGIGLTVTDDQASAPPAPRTTPVVQGDLASGIALMGQLGYGTPTDIVGDGGVVTAIPDPGAVISSGESLYGHDGQPAFLLRGGTPLWRVLKLGDRGRDVVALRAALTAAGYDAGKPDKDIYDTALTKAVGRFYTDRGYPEPAATDATADARKEADEALGAAKAELATAKAAWANAKSGTTPGDTEAESAAVTAARQKLGRAQEARDAAYANQVGPADFVLVEQDALRVDTVHAVVGQHADGPVLSWTPNSVKAFAELTAAQSTSLATGTATTVRLPDNTEVPGTITAILPAETGKGGEKVPPRAQIELQDPAAGASLGSVRITVPGETVSDALIVPVTALLALAEGGYAVQVASPSNELRLVPVTLGLIADTRAQVVSDALKAGDKVVIP